MPVDVTMPQMGESIFEGTITKWLKKPGDHVERDEPLFEISTDKVDAEIPAPSAGVLKEIKVGEGQTVPIQTVVAVIEAAGAAATEPAAAPTPRLQEKMPEPGKAPAAPAPAAAAPVPQPPATTPSPAPPAARDDGHKVSSSPLVRRLAKEHNIDLSTIEGSGPGGRISKKDILAAIESGGARPSPPQAAPAEAPARRPSAPPPVPAAAVGAQAHAALENAVPHEKIYFGDYEARPMSAMRQRIAEHMVISKRVSPHVYSVDEADMTGIVKLRERSKGEFESKYGTKLTYMPFFVRACVEGLRAFPAVNASVDGTTIVLHREMNIGIAVALDGGLIVPVLSNAEEKNFLGLARGINDLAERARGKKLKPEEVQESTFSITNPGIYGGLMGLPVINQPNVAILGIGAIQKRPVVSDDAIAVRSMVYLTLSYDHRAVDGAVAHQFMGRVKSALEGWTEEIL
jgi:pyruvate dehydrogenase E2 component (dihydrolipoyllysine-residue acetyltransferase)